MKNTKSIESIFIKAWYRNVQQLTIQEHSSSPMASKVIDALIRSGMDNLIDKSTASRWCSGKSTPSKKIKNDIDTCTKSRASDWLYNTRKIKFLPPNPQIRLVKYSAIWANSSIKPHEATEILIKIQNKWQPEILTPNIVNLRKKIECQFSEPKLADDDSTNLVYNPNQINFRYINQIDPTSIVLFLLSLLELNWPLDKVYEGQHFFYNYTFADLCVDFLGACLLTDRLHLALGYYSYKQGSAGIGVAKKLMHILLSSHNSLSMYTPDALIYDFGKSGYQTNDQTCLLKNISTMKNLLDRMIFECGSEWKEITDIQLPLYHAMIFSGYPNIEIVGLSPP